MPSAAIVAPVRPAPALLEERPRLAEVADHLADEERIPLGLAPDGVRERDQRAVELVAGHGGHQGLDRRVVEPCSDSRSTRSLAGDRPTRR